ncbi:immunity 51 family protein [Corynebacterium sp. TAE3-ERU30]|uniref:immunity 51 family protein n=1 Tax=Corynebacterium sp. TAE3-ERU30 TaxID=2849496 RepID=UPI001C48E4B1|nr:immunity 51 family protein [Corynebacterium sp. TAE3-ERU30]MBV7282631.1 immunity 51 family protein [Corynebacterium sp. TAE3-ERU30]
MATDTDAISEEVEEVVSKAGYEPHGYFIEGLASFLLISNGQAPEELSCDSEAGMFSVIGSKDVLEPLKQQRARRHSSASCGELTLLPGWA